MQGREARLEDAVPGDYGAGWVLGDDVSATFGFDGGVSGHFESIRSDDGGSNDYFRLELCGTDGVLTFWSGTTRQEVFFYPAPFALPTTAGDWQTIPAPPRQTRRPPRCQRGQGQGRGDRPAAGARCIRPTTSWRRPCWRR